MKSAIFTILLCICSTFSFAQITTQPLTSSVFCAGETINVSYTVSPNANAGNKFQIQLSSPTGAFTTPTILTTIIGTTSNTTAITLPKTLAAGTQYRIRVTGDNPVVTGTNNGTNLTIKTLPIAEIGSFATDLYFSEYVEGTSSNKYLEIYNGTSQTIDLSNYRLLSYFNGNTTPLYNNQLSGTLASGGVIVYQNSAATGPAAIPLANINFNGNDAFALLKISTGDTIDIFGRIGEDPGLEWTMSPNHTLDATLRRKTTVLQGVKNNPSSGFPTLLSEWDLYPVDDFSNLGSHAHDKGIKTLYCSADKPDTLKAKINGGTFSGTGITNTTLGIFTPAAATIGTNTINYTTTLNGCTNNTSVTLTVKTSPTVAIGTGDTTFSCTGTVSLNAMNVGASYLWNTGSSNQAITVATAGKYNVNIVAANGCKGTDTTVVIFPSTNGGVGFWKWEGNTSTDWFDACNWDKKSLPNNLSSVIIESGSTFYPLVKGGIAKCKTISINSTLGAKITIDKDNGGELSVSP